MALLTTIRRMNGVAVAYCGGRLVLGEESKSLRLLVKDLLNKSPQIVLDLGDVTHMDSGGLGALVALYTSARADRKSTRLNSSHVRISYAVFCLKKKKKRHSVTVTYVDHSVRSR